MRFVVVLVGSGGRCCHRRAMVIGGDGNGDGSGRDGYCLCSADSGVEKVLVVLLLLFA